MQSHSRPSCTETGNETLLQACMYLLHDLYNFAVSIATYNRSGLQTTIPCSTQLSLIPRPLDREEKRAWFPQFAHALNSSGFHQYVPRMFDLRLCTHDVKRRIHVLAHEQTVETRPCSPPSLGPGDEATQTCMSLVASLLSSCITSSLFSGGMAPMYSNNKYVN